MSTDAPTSEPTGLAQQIEEFIPDDSTVVTVKWNVPTRYNIEEDEWQKDIPFCSVKDYLEEYGATILAYTTGLHTNGENARPHVHMHFICEQFPTGKLTSQHRTRWCDKTESDLDGCTFKYQKLKEGTPKYAVLSYPFKEGFIVPHKLFNFYNNKPMTAEIKAFLKETGVSIYQSALAIAMRHKLMTERRARTLGELLDLVKNRSFTELRTMMQWLDTEYIQKLDITDYPDPKIYKTHCQKIAIHLGILKYSDL